MRVEDARERHPAARELDLDQRVGREVEPEAAVLLGDRHAEEPHLLHLLDERRPGTRRHARARRRRERRPSRRTRERWRRSPAARLPAPRHYAAISQGERRASSARGRSPALEGRDRALDGRDCVGVERERRIVPELLAHLSIAQRVLRRSRLVGQLGLERATVRRPKPGRHRERHADTSRSRAPRTGPSVRARACRVLQHVVRVGREVDAAVDEHRSGRVLEAELALVGRPGTELRVLGLEYHRDERFGNGDGHLVDLLDRHVVEQGLGGTQGAVHEVTRRVRLVRDAERLPAAAEVARAARRGRARRRRRTRGRRRTGRRARPPGPRLRGRRAARPARPPARPSPRGRASSAFRR